MLRKKLAAFGHWPRRPRCCGLLADQHRRRIRSKSDGDFQDRALCGGRRRYHAAELSGVGERRERRRRNQRRGKKLKIEVIEYDERSNSEEMIKAVERLATQDKVDFILPPWSTGMDFAAAPIFNKLGYPQLAVTANTNQALELTKRWPNLTFGSACHRRSSTVSSRPSPSSRRTARSTRRSR